MGSCNLTPAGNVRTTIMKDQIKSQIEQLESNGNVVKARAWWNSLSPQKKALAIAVLVAVGSTTVFYFVFSNMTYYTATAVATSGGGQAIGYSASAYSTFSCVSGAIGCGSILGYAAYTKSLDHYSATDKLEVAEEYSL